MTKQHSIIKKFCVTRNIDILKKLTYSNLNFLLTHAIIAYSTVKEEDKKDLAQFIINFILLKYSGKKWELQEEIASGTYGSIYSTTENCIIKKQEFGIEFFREVNIYKKINNSKISPRFYDAWVDKEGNSYIVLERMIGDMESNNIQPSQAIKDRLLKLVNILHKYNITHNDIQTTNVIFKNNPEIANNFYLFDYGMSIDFTGIDKNKKINIDKWQKISFEEGKRKDIYNVINLSGP